MSDENAKTVKKIGLARLAKARSMSGGINSVGLDIVDPENLNSPDAFDWIDDQEPTPEKEIPAVDHPTTVPHVSNYYIRQIPIELEKETSSTVQATGTSNTTVEEKKIDLAVASNSTAKPVEQEELALQSPTVERKESTMPEVIPITMNTTKEVEGTVSPVEDPASPGGSSTVPGENDEENASGSSPFKKSFLQSFHRRSKKKRDQQLGIPKVGAKRSRSLTRLTDAFSQVHTVCVLPAAQSSAESEITKDGSDRPLTWYSLENKSNSSDEDVSSDDYDSASPESGDTVGNLPPRRWSSMDHIDASSPMSLMKAADARQKNYLFGGLGSLLGTTELQRYFPDRSVTIFIATWNMNGKEPPVSLDDFLLPDNMDTMPDMYVVGTQESGGDRQEWEVRLQTTIGPSHVLFSSTMLGILHLTVFLRRDLVWFCSVPEEAYYSLRPGTYFKTKGAIAISFQFFGTTMLFVNTHLFAHEEKLAQRVQNYKNIIHNLDVPRNLRSHKNHKSKDVTHRYDIIFWMGDLNFRLVGDREEILMMIQKNPLTEIDIQELLLYDQLTQSKNKGDVFKGFDEGKINFAPTFKFDVGTNSYDSSSKQRVPSYTDRILYKSTRDPIKCSSYNSCPLFKSSDHKPVCGVYNFKVRPGKDDVPLAAGLFQRDVYLAALKRRRKFFHQPSSKNCQMQ